MQALHTLKNKHQNIRSMRSFKNNKSLPAPLNPRSSHPRKRILKRSSRITLRKLGNKNSAANIFRQKRNAFSTWSNSRRTTQKCRKRSFITGPMPSLKKHKTTQKSSRPKITLTSEKCQETKLAGKVMKLEKPTKTKEL